MSSWSRWLPRLALFGIILSTCIGCDQATKRIATQTLVNAPPQTFLGGTVRLEYALNPGGFLSVGGGLPDAMRQTLFVGFNVCMMLGIGALFVMHSRMSLMLFVGLTCIIAGGIGNLIDRVTNRGLVTDFINVGIGPLRTGIFNVADMAVMLGGLLVLLHVHQRSKLPVSEPASQS